jgi:hypothetical protein
LTSIKITVYYKRKENKMKYRTVKINEIIPRNAEIWYHNEWVNYYDKCVECGNIIGEFNDKNYVYEENEIRVPIEENEENEVVECQQ